MPTVWVATLGIAGALAVAALTVALYGQQRIKSLEQELVRRQQDSQRLSTEARTLSQQAADVAHAVESKIGLLEARVAETALQRSQLEELIQQLSRSRDENLLADLDAAIRVAMQQSALTGGVEPLAAALRQAEERLARASQPRLERVRRALARDIDRAKAVSAVDVAGLAIKLDEAVRSVDDLPLVVQAAATRSAAAERAAAATAAAAGTNPAIPGGGAAAGAGTRVPGRGASAPAVAAAAEPEWRQWLQAVPAWADRVWGEIRGLVRVTRIERPEAMLIAPDQAWFLRENLKLRLLNARLALLSRQFDTAQADLREVQATLDRWFDRSARRVAVTADVVRQVGEQARQLNLPRPDETLAAIAAAQAGR